MDARDTSEIRSLIARQFTALSWDGTNPPDWDGFVADFLPAAPLFPSARPLAPSTVSAFVDRMKSLSETSLRSFQEEVLGTTIHVFGQVAVAVVVCEVTENEKEKSRNVEMILLVKDNGSWKIVAQAWDRATPTLPVPASFFNSDALGAADDAPAQGGSQSSGR
jgi:hypothetical protein